MNGQPVYHRRQWLGGRCTEGLCVDTVVQPGRQRWVKSKLPQRPGEGRGWQMSSSKYQSGAYPRKGLGAGVRTDKEEEEPRRSGKLLVEKSSREELWHNYRPVSLLVLLLSLPGRRLLVSVAVATRKASRRLSLQFPHGGFQKPQTPVGPGWRERWEKPWGTGFRESHQWAFRQRRPPYLQLFLHQLPGRASWPFCSPATQKCHLACSWRGSGDQTLCYGLCHRLGRQP